MSIEERRKDVNCLKEAIKYGDINSAVKDGNKDAVRHFLKTGSQAYTKSDIGDNNTPLHVAAYNKNFDMFKFLYESIPEDKRLEAINIPNKNGLTPLLEVALMPQFTNDEMLENMPKLASYIIYHGGDTSKQGFVNGQTEYKGKIRYLDFLQTLELQLDDYNKNSREYQTINKCIQQYNQLNCQKLSYFQANQLSS